MSSIATIEGVCEVELHGGAGVAATAPPDLLIEIPHAATRREHYESLRRRLASPLPADLEQFFFVNTDAGAPEVATAVARRIAETQPRRVLVLRCLVPRTFVDCNRASSAETDSLHAAGYTPLIPPYVTEPGDVALLHSLHDAYQATARQAIAGVCGTGGTALLLHTFAPRSVDVRVDEDIVPALRRAYEPGVFETWPKRPAVDLICEDAAGRMLAPEPLLRRLEQRYAEAGVAVARNATYRLHPQTMGYEHSVAWPGRVVCLEIDRALLARPFVPFEELRIGEAEVQRMAAPIAEAWFAHFAAESMR